MELNKRKKNDKIILKKFKKNKQLYMRNFSNCI